MRVKHMNKGRRPAQHGQMGSTWTAFKNPYLSLLLPNKKLAHTCMACPHTKKISRNNYINPNVKRRSTNKRQNKTNEKRPPHDLVFASPNRNPYILMLSVLSRSVATVWCGDIYIQWQMVIIKRCT